MDWTVFDRSYVLGAVPLVMQDRISTLLTTLPAFAAKVDETIASTRADFRLALSQAGNALDDDETKLPNTCLRYAYLVVEYEMARMVNGYAVNGVSYAWTPQISTLIRAEVYQRAIVETKQNLETGGLAPSYEADLADPDRALPEEAPR